MANEIEYGLDCGVLGKSRAFGFGVYSLRPVTNDSGDLIGIVFGPGSVISGVDNIRQLADDVLEYQLTGKTDDERIKECYFGWTRAYASLAYVTTDHMPLSNFLDHPYWGDYVSSLPTNGVPYDLMNIIMGYAGKVNAMANSGEFNKQSVDNLVSSGEAYKVSFYACEPKALSHA